MDIAHILDLVLSNVEKRHDLSQCVRVNHLWHSIGIGYLWRGQPLLGPELTMIIHVPAQTLFELSKDVTRFKHYAQHIKHLNLTFPDNRDTTAEQIEPFQKQVKQLMRAELWDSCPLTTFKLQYGFSVERVNCDAALAVPMLRSQLRKLSIDGARITSSFLESLKAISLRWLSLRFFHEEISNRILQSFLASQQDLLGLSLRFIDATPSKYAASFTTIANLPKLRHFQTNMELDTVIPLDSDNHHFGSLESLRAPPSFFHRVIANNIEKLISLRALTLTGPGMDEFNPDEDRSLLNTTLRTLSRVSTLEAVEIWNEWVEEEDLNEAFVDFAKSNPELRKFEIYYDDVEDYPAEELTTASILAMASSCPKLENLSWPWQISSTFLPFLETLLDIAPQLRSLNVYMDLPLRSVPSLPLRGETLCLQELTVGGIAFGNAVELGDDGTLKLFDTLADRLPRLRYLGSSSYDSIGGIGNIVNVVRDWRKKIDQRPVLEARPNIDIEIEREALEQ